ncbi:MAG: hypothetical protein IPO14_03700 [Saprospiraceae bacterium]|nr:hypothetical protein [Saprospiraceae bacterium]
MPIFPSGNTPDNSNKPSHSIAYYNRVNSLRGGQASAIGTSSEGASHLVDRRREETEMKWSREVRDPNSSSGREKGDAQKTN